MINKHSFEAPLLHDTHIYTIYPSRWTMLGLFCFLSMTNAMMWITFAPISDDVSTYLGGMSTTSVNMLSITFQIMYGPGTFFSVIAMKRYSYYMFHNYYILIHILLHILCSIYR
jgi:FLVCR family MFS transporter 7